MEDLSIYRDEYPEEGSQNEVGMTFEGLCVGRLPMLEREMILADRLEERDRQPPPFFKIDCERRGNNLEYVKDSNLEVTARNWP